MVSTNAATSAATKGAAIKNNASGAGVTFGRHHQAEHRACHTSEEEERARTSE